MNKTKNINTPGGKPTTLENPPSTEVDPTDSGGDHLLQETTKRVQQQQPGHQINREAEADRTKTFDFFPFRKSTRTARSPIKTQKSEAATKTTGVQKTAVPNSTPTIASMAGSPLVIKKGNLSQLLEKLGEVDEDGEAVLEKELMKIQEAMKLMLSASVKQKNISMDIKKGLMQLQESMEIIWICRKKQNAAKQERKLCSKEYNLSQHHQESLLPKAPEKETPKSVKRLRDPDPLENGLESPCKEGKESRGSEWKQVTSKKQKVSCREKEKEKESAQNKQFTKGPEKRDLRTISQKEDSKRRKQKKRKKKEKEDAIIVKPNEGKTYADILREIREGVDPGTTETEITEIRKTAKGEMLLKMARTRGNRNSFRKELQEILGSTAQIKNPRNTSMIEIRDLDCLTTEQEIKAAIEKHMQKEVACKISVSKPNGRELVFAVVDLDLEEANLLLKAGKIRIGLIYCRIKARTEVRRCFRCLGFGHIKSSCKQKDRSECCYKCGAKGHIAKSCHHATKCFLCEERNEKQINHISGSRSCVVFRTALEEAKKRQR